MHPQQKASRAEESPKQQPTHAGAYQGQIFFELLIRPKNPSLGEGVFPKVIWAKTSTKPAIGKASVTISGLHGCGSEHRGMTAQASQLRHVSM